MIDIILASSSPYRRELLSRLKLPFQCHSPEIDETALPDESFEDHVQRLSIAKAQAVSQTYPKSVCIGSDEIATLGTDILGKPLNHPNAILQLTKMSGQTVTFYTGVAVVIGASDYLDYRLVTTQVRFRDLSPKMIENYLNKEQPYHSAGSFKSETLGSALITQFEGTDPTALIGLPLIALTEMLGKAGMDVI
jgi:septum formation protein